ncbi:MAG TPA: hypothetical protein VME24_07240 [Alphaproteobacteria bacterium]|nr:hypothetical protein [Alphaproteobacteria bacterium]
MALGCIICSVVAHGARLTCAATSIGLIVAILYFRIFFRNWDDFQDAWGDFARGVLARQLSGRISFWIMISIGSGFLAYFQLPKWFPHLFGHLR